MPPVLKADDVLTPVRLGVRDEGEQVVLEVADFSLKMDHRTALTLSAWLKHHGRRAKRAAGDQARLVTALGTLTDASAPETKINGG